MLHKIVDQLIKTFGREVLEQWVPLERLSITSIADPELTLTNIPLPDKLFESPSIPFVPIKSNLGRVVVKCPWKTFLNSDRNVALTVEIYDLDAVLRFKRLDEWSTEHVRGIMLSLRDVLLRKWNSMVSSFGLLSTNKGAKGSKAVALVNSLDITIHNLKIVLLDNLLYKEPFSITIEAERVHGVSMRPDDPSLNEEEQRGIENSLLVAMWFNSSGVHMSHAIYHQEPSEAPSEQHGLFAESKCKSHSQRHPEGRDVDESTSTDSSHSSDELFDDLDERGGPNGQVGTDDTHLWNFCSAPCRNLTEHEWTEKFIQEVKREDEALIRLMQGLHKTCNITPPQGLRFDLVFKNWNLAAFYVLENMSKQKRKIIQLCFSAVDKDGENIGAYAPCFNGENPFEPFDLILTSAGSEILYNIVRYIQLVSAFRELATENIDAIPKVEDCQRYIDITSTSHWRHMEEDAKFVDEFERTVPFHILLKIKQIVHSSQNRGATANVCFIGTDCCSRQVEENGDQEYREDKGAHSYEWYERESMIRIVFSNVNLCIVPLNLAQHDCVIPSAMFQFSTFAFQSGTRCKRATYKILACKPIIRLGLLNARVKKRTFSARVILWPNRRSESLLCYPEQMFTNPCEFFDNYGSDELERCLNDTSDDRDTTLKVNMERYTDYIKHIHVMVPKVVLLFNVLVKLNALVGDGLWNANFLTLEQFIERNEKYGHPNKEVARMMMEHMEVTNSRTLCKIDLEGMILCALLQNGVKRKYAIGLDIDSIDKQSRTHCQQNVLDWFLSNDKVLNMWKYCEDIDDPFVCKRSESWKQDIGRATSKEVMPNTVYCKENFVAELDAKSLKYCEKSTSVLVLGGNAKFSMNSKVLNHLATLRRWYHNTWSVEIPGEYITDLDALNSIAFEVKSVSITRDPLTELTYCTIEHATLTSLDPDGSVTDLLVTQETHVIKRGNALCIEFGNIDTRVDTRLPVFTRILRHREAIRTFIHNVITLINNMKRLTEFDQRLVSKTTDLTGNADVCRIIQQDFYTASHDLSEECNPDLLDALERKLHGVDGDKDVVFLSAATLRVSMGDEGALYEAVLHKMQFEVQGKERFRAYLNNMAVYTIGDGTKHLILSSKSSELGKEDPITLGNMENGQVVIDYTISEPNSMNVEIRNVHHLVDMQFLSCVTKIVKQFKTTSSQDTPKRNRNILCNLMVHHSSAHYSGIGAIIDIYAVVKLEDSAVGQCLLVKLPRFHATLTKGLTQRVIAVSLLDVVFDMTRYISVYADPSVGKDGEHHPKCDAMIVNIVFELSHCAVWGFHSVEGLTNLKQQFDNVNDAAGNLEMLLHETWFNHMTVATLPSCYDEDAAVLIPLVSTQYSEAARLTPLLNHMWISDWLVAASQTVDPHLCDGAAENVLKAFPKEALQQGRRSSVRAKMSAVVCDDAIVSMGDVGVVSLGVFLHCESLRNLMNLFSQCEAVRSQPEPSDKHEISAKIVKININIADIDIICSSDAAINCTNTMASSLLPTTIADIPLPRKRPLAATSKFHILCIYRLQRIYFSTVADISVVLQRGVTLSLVNTLYNRIEYLQGVKQYDLFDHIDVLDDVKYQATLHFFDTNYTEGQGNIVSLNCSRMQTSMHTTLNRFEYWNDIMKRTASDEDCEVPSFIKDFKMVLQLNLTNLNVDLCLASKSIYATKLTIQQINLVDAWGKFLLEDLYDSRCTLANLGHLDEATFCNTTDQVAIRLTVMDEVSNVKVELEQTRSEIQINGISAILGALQDMGLFKLKRKEKNENNEKKKRVKLELSLNLHELWFYPALSNDGAAMNNVLPSSGSAQMSPTDTQALQIDYKETTPHVLKVAKEVEYHNKMTSSKAWGSGDQQKESDENVIGCLISLSVSSSKMGNSVANLKYMGLTLGDVKSVHGVKVIVDECNDILFNTLEADERILFEVRESVLKSKMLENGHIVIAFQTSKPKLSVNVDQLFKLCLLKPYIVDSAISTLRAHQTILRGKRDLEPTEETPFVDMYDLNEEIKSVAAKYNLPILDLTNMQGSVYNVPPEVVERNRLALRGREKGSRILKKLIGYLNKLIWKDEDTQLSFSVALNDCKCVLFSVKNELVLTFNLQQMSFNLTHTAPVCNRKTIVDSTLVFNVTTYNSNLNYHDTVLKTTVATMQVAYDATNSNYMPVLDISMHVSGVAVEVNVCLLQLFNQLKNVSSMLSSEQMGITMKHEKTVRLYNELDVDVSIISSKVGCKETTELMQLPIQKYTQVPDKEIYVFIKDSVFNGANNRVINLLSGQFEVVNGASSRNTGPEWIVREGKNLLFGNSNNVRSLLHMFHGQGNSTDLELNIDEICKADQSLMLIGKYHMEQTGSRLFNVPNSSGLVLMEQYISEDNNPYVILSSSIRILNSTDIPMNIQIGNKLGYFTKVAYKLTQHAKPKENLKEMYLEPFTSSCVPLSWFGTGMMPTIAPVFDKGDATADTVPFQYLHNLLNMNQRGVSDFERVNDFVLKFRGFMALKCSVVAKEAASTDESGSCFYHFTIKIEPMVKLVNILPSDIYVVLSLNRVKLSDDPKVETGDRSMQLNSYKVHARLKPGETMGIPFSEQKLFIRISVFGTQMDANSQKSKAVTEEFEYVSPIFQIYLPTVGTASIVKLLRIYKGSVTALMDNSIDRQANGFQVFEDHLKSMYITMDLSRNDIRVWWPFIFENISSTPLIINGYLLEPMARFHGNLSDASNCRIRALLYTNGCGEQGKHAMYSMSRCVKLNATSTTDFRPPINLIVPLKRSSMTHASIADTGINVDCVLESFINTTHLPYARRHLPHEYGNNEEQPFVNDVTEDDVDEVTDLVAASNNNAFICLGSTVRYAEYPYNMCKIVSVTNLYTFVNRLPFTICVRGTPEEHQRLQTGSSEVASDVVIMPGESGVLNSPFQGAYIIKMKNDISSGIFSLHYPRLPYVFQLELNSNNITYSTIATRGLLVQVNVISGAFEGSKMPYSYNGYYFVLSFPHKPQYQILNLTTYTLAYTVPENMKSMEAKLVDSYESYEPTWLRTPMNKIGILPSTCITHYVPAANSKSLEVLQVCLKVLHVEACEWHIQQVDFASEGYQVIKFINEGNACIIYTTIMIRSNGTRIITVVDSKPAAIELNRLGGVSMSMVPRLQWSHINFSFLTPRITVTLSTKRKVILALHLTNAALGLSITPSKSRQAERDSRDSRELELSKSAVIELDGVIQSIHIDHFVQGYIPVILKSSAKRSSLNDSFLHLGISSSNYMALGLPVYDLIQVKLSPLSINIEMCVIEQLIESIEGMLKLPIGNIVADAKAGASTNPLVVPQPKWVEMEPAPPVYIRRLMVEPINLILAIRTSSLQLAHQTMRILDALPLDTPCVCVHFAKEERAYLIVGWRELMHSLRNSYLRQLIRQSLPSAWLSNSFAIFHGLVKGLVFLVVQPVQSAARFKNVLEGFTVGICNGIMLFALYIAGGTAQSLGHFLNIFHKIIGGHRSNPQGVLDAIWLGLNVLLLHVFYRPWKRLIGDFLNSKSRGDGFFKTSMGLVLNLARCAVSPVIGAVNMAITIVEGFSNVLLGDFEQFTHVYESEQLDKGASTNPSFTDKQSDVKEMAASQNTFVKRMKTSIGLRRKVN